MAGTIDWQLATIRAIRSETAMARTFTLAMPAWPGHRPGQHVDLRLTAEDGYSVERSYSIASGPESGPQIDITVDRIEGGEVSPFLHDVVVVGDRIEVRGPIGGYFVWDAALADAPVLLVAGGSGLVPLMAMVRHRAAAGIRVPTALLVSARRLDDLLYARELEDLAAAGDGLTVTITLTRDQPPGWSGYRRRVDDAMLAEIVAPLGERPRAYVCGPTALVEVAANGLVRLGLPPDRIRTERFGPSGT